MRGGPPAAECGVYGPVTPPPACCWGAANTEPGGAPPAPPNEARAANGEGCLAVCGTFGERTPYLSSLGSRGSVMGRVWKWVPASTKPFCKPVRPALQSSMLLSRRCMLSAVLPRSLERPESRSLVAWISPRNPSSASDAFSSSWRRPAASAAFMRHSRRTSAVAKPAFSKFSPKAACFFSRPSIRAPAFWSWLVTSCTLVCSVAVRAFVRLISAWRSACPSLDTLNCLCACSTSRESRSCASLRSSCPPWTIAPFCWSVCTASCCCFMCCFKYAASFCKASTVGCTLESWFLKPSICFIVSASRAACRTLFFWCAFRVVTVWSRSARVSWRSWPLDRTSSRRWLASPDARARSVFKSFTALVKTSMACSAPSVRSSSTFSETASNAWSRTSWSPREVRDSAAERATSRT
mmetsp:Transcript_30817/g.89584  ORF Transcript_30817/g.89584 Transcript_30817/m.89584 type:complete len:410 (+) Transcript_30817:517-1746(+)